jgi:hypothetical protein
MFVDKRFCAASDYIVSRKRKHAPAQHDSGISLVHIALHSLAGRVTAFVPNLALNFHGDSMTGKDVVPSPLALRVKKKFRFDSEIHRLHVFLKRAMSAEKAIRETLLA